jgi:hypothetical protein
MMCQASGALAGCDIVPAGTGHPARVACVCPEHARPDQGHRVGITTGPVMARSLPHLLLASTVATRRCLP